MTINPNFITREIAGELVIVPVGPASAKAGLITMNTVGAFIWSLLEKGSDETAILNAILNEFEVDKQTAKTDMDEFLTMLRTLGAIQQE